MMGWQWHQLDHMQIICTTLQTDNHAVPHHSVFTGWMPFLPANQQRQSTEGINCNTQYNHRKTKSDKQLLGLFMCVHCTVHNCCTQYCTEQTSDNFPSYPPDNHHCSDDVYLRDGGHSSKK